MNNQVTLQDAAKIIDRLGRYFPMLVRNGSEVVNDWYPFIAQFPLDVAHDVLHDGFIKIFTNFSFRGESSLCTWISRVMVTQALDYLRREKRVNQLVVHEEQLPDIPDISDSGGGAGISEEQLMTFVAELPDGCRTVFNLYVFEEKSHKEIAKLLHIKEHSSTSQLHRAKYLLAKRIKEYRNHEERK